MTNEELREKVVEAADAVAAEMPDVMKIMDHQADYDVSERHEALTKFATAVRDRLGTGFLILEAAMELVRWEDRRRRAAINRGSE